MKRKALQCLHLLVHTGTTEETHTKTLWKGMRTVVSTTRRSQLVKMARAEETRCFEHQHLIGNWKTGAPRIPLPHSVPSLLLDSRLFRGTLGPQQGESQRHTVPVTDRWHLKHCFAFFLSSLCGLRVIWLRHLSPL